MIVLGKIAAISGASLAWLLLLAFADFTMETRYADERAALLQWVRGLARDPLRDDREQLPPSYRPGDPGRLGRVWRRER